MKIETLRRRKETDTNKKLAKAYNKMESLMEALEKMNLPADEVTSINQHIILINSFEGTEKALIKILKKTYSNILTVMEENLEYVPKHHFRARWMVYGIMAGAVFSSVFSSFELIGMGSSASIGLSMSMLIGIVIGDYFDTQAKKEGRQIEIQSAEH